MDKRATIYIISYISLNDKNSLVGALRPYRLKEYLIRKGFNAKIITPKRSSGEEIVIEEGKLLKSIKFLTRVFPPDFTVFWSFIVFLRMRKIWKKEFFYIVTTAPPYGVGLVGLILKWLNYKCYWVCDYRDIWLDNPLYNPPFTKKYFDPWFERSNYRLCDIMVFNTNWDRDHNIKRYPFLANKSLYVRNGFDVVKENISNDSLSFVYAGGTSKGLATPTIINLLASLNKSGLNVCCDFYGEYDDSMAGTSYIMYKGVLPSEEIAKTLINYKFGVIYLPPGSEFGGRISQKFYDYIGSGVIPICIRPSVEMRNLMLDLGVGISILDEWNVEDLVNQIQKAKFDVPKEKWIKLTREYQFGKLSDRIL